VSTVVDLAALDVAAAADLAPRLAAAGLACFPTDTVYGVGGALSPAVLAALAAAKGRAGQKPVQVVFPTRELLLAHVPLGRRLQDACRRLLPGPVTLLVPYPKDWHFPPAGEVIREPQGRQGAVATLGVRVPRWPEAARLLATLPFPLLASSANRSGEPAARALDEVDPAVRSACTLLLDAGRVAGIASSVVDLSSFEEDGDWRLLRVGAWDEVTVEERLTARRPDLPPR
jgi:L-threonylcarbamoyladenylate synthase